MFLSLSQKNFSFDTSPARSTSPAVGHAVRSFPMLMPSIFMQSVAERYFQIAAAALQQCVVVYCLWTWSRSTCCSLDLSCSARPISARCRVPQAGTPRCWQGWWRTYRRRICTESFPARQRRGLRQWQRTQLVQWLNPGWYLRWHRTVWTVRLRIQCSGNDYWRSQQASCK